MKRHQIGLVVLLLVGACGGEGASDPEPKSVAWPRADLSSRPAADAGVARVDSASSPQPVSCPNVAGTWKGTIEGKANTYLQNVQMTGTVVMTVVAGASPNEFKLTALDVEAWSPLLPMFKVPLKTIGAHSFQCGTLKLNAPIEAQGKKGAGVIDGQCSATQCTGTFKGKTDDETMDAEGKFTISRP